VTRIDLNQYFQIFEVSYGFDQVLRRLSKIELGKRRGNLEWAEQRAGLPLQRHDHCSQTSTHARLQTVTGTVPVPIGTYLLGTYLVFCMCFVLLKNIYAKKSLGTY